MEGATVPAFLLQRILAANGAAQNDARNRSRTDDERRDLWPRVSSGFGPDSLVGKPTRGPVQMFGTAKWSDKPREIVIKGCENCKPRVKVAGESHVARGWSSEEARGGACGTRSTLLRGDGQSVGGSADQEAVGGFDGDDVRAGAGVDRVLRGQLAGASGHREAEGGEDHDEQPGAKSARLPTGAPEKPATADRDEPQPSMARAIADDRELRVVVMLMTCRRRRDGSGRQIARGGARRGGDGAGHRDRRANPASGVSVAVTVGVLGGPVESPAITVPVGGVMVRVKSTPLPVMAAFSPLYRRLVELTPTVPGWGAVGGRQEGHLDRAGCAGSDRAPHAAVLTVYCPVAAKVGSAVGRRRCWSA